MGLFCAIINWKGSDTMYIGGTDYDDVQEVLARPQHELARKYLIQNVYKAYVSFRSILGGQKCQKMPLFKVKEALQNEENIAKIMHIYPKYTQESIETILTIAENHIPMIK